MVEDIIIFKLTKILLYLFGIAIFMFPVSIFVGVIKNDGIGIFTGTITIGLMIVWSLFIIWCVSRIKVVIDDVIHWILDYKD